MNRGPMVVLQIDYEPGVQDLALELWAEDGRTADPSSEPLIWPGYLYMAARRLGFDDPFRYSPAI